MILSTKLMAHVAIGAAAYVVATEALETITPWADVLSANALIGAAHGALGGACRWLFLQETLRDGLRLTLLGAVLAFGVGSLWQLVIAQWVKVPDSILAQPHAAYSGAFIVGLLAGTILGRFLDDPKKS